MNKRINPKQVTPLFSHNHLESWRSPNSIAKVNLSGDSITALARVASQSTDDNFLSVSPADIPECADMVAEIQNEILNNSGVVILNRFPVESYPTDVSRRAAGILSNQIAPLMPQDINGTMLYDVMDEGPQKSSTTRRSKTNVEQPFHTDGPWFSVPPKIISLFCLQPAASGGLSQVSSLQLSLLELFEEKPDSAELLVDHDTYWNRMGQFTGVQEPYSSHPVVEMTDTGTLIRHYADYVRTGCELANQPIDDELDYLLGRLETLLRKNACEPFRLESGEAQYVNNSTVTHARANFSDEDTSTEGTSTGRHLIRLWNKPTAPAAARQH